MRFRETMYKGGRHSKICKCKNKYMAHMKKEQVTTQKTK